MEPICCPFPARRPSHCPICRNGQRKPHADAIYNYTPPIVIKTRRPEERKVYNTSRDVTLLRFLTDSGSCEVLKQSKTKAPVNAFIYVCTPHRLLKGSAWENRLKDNIFFVQKYLFSFFLEIIDVICIIIEYPSLSYKFKTKKQASCVAGCRQL